MLMSGDLVVRWLELLGGFSVLLQCFEYARITASTDAQGVWAWQVQRADIPDQPAWLKRSLDWLYQPVMYKLQLWVRALAAMALMVSGNHLAIALLLFIGNLLLLIRWRGAFNGGSDFMTLITATGLLIAQVVERLTDAQTGWSAGLGYIAIQTLSSYFVSGWVKLKRPEWRNGQALPVFLNSGLYGPLKKDSVFRRPVVAFPKWDTAVCGCGAAVSFLGFLVFWAEPVFLGLGGKPRQHFLPEPLSFLTCMYSLLLIYEINAVLYVIFYRC
jgi:hypothetical protein